MRTVCKVVISSVSLVVATGCFSRESRVDAPVMDPEAMTQRCMELVDSDGDGFLTDAELKSTPGLRSALVDLDENQDERLDRDEIFQRFQLYVDSRVGLQGLSCTVTLNGQPLRDGQVELVPEPFMAPYIEPAHGEVINADTGFAEISTDPELPGVRPGFYRVEITSRSIEIAPRYNENTIYGIEVAPIQQENPRRHFDVKRG